MKFIKKQPFDVSTSTEAFFGTDRFEEGLSRGRNVNINLKRLFFNEFHHLMLQPFITASLCGVKCMLACLRCSIGCFRQSPSFNVIGTPVATCESDGTFYC